jgi:hypothetical protein
MTDQPKPAKFCPMLSAGPQDNLEPCHRENCAWYNTQSQCCAILLLGRGPSASRSEARPLTQPPATSEMKTPSPPRSPGCARTAVTTAVPAGRAIGPTAGGTGIRSPRAPWLAARPGSRGRGKVPRCSICGKRLGLRSDYVHVVNSGRGEWYCQEHWENIQKLADWIIRYRTSLAEVRQAQAVIQSQLSELLNRLNRRRKGQRARAAQGVTGGPARAPAK